MKNNILMLLALLVSGSVVGQHIASSVIGTSGGFSQTSAGTLHWTIGEFSIAAYSADGIYWGEGFQQVWSAPVVSTDNPQHAPVIAFRVYPNPSTDFVRVESDTPLRVQLIDLSGRPVTDMLSFNGFAEIDLRALPAGFFLLRACDQQGRTAAVAKVQHIR